MKNIINNAIMYGSFTHRKYMSFYCYVIEIMPRQLRNQPINMAVKYQAVSRKGTKACRCIRDLYGVHNYFRYAVRLFMVEVYATDMHG